MTRLTDRDREAVLVALEQLPAPMRFGWGWWKSQPQGTLDQWEVLAVLQSGGPTDDLVLAPEVSLAISRVYGRLERLTAWHIHCAHDDLCRSIPDFRQKLHADLIALAEELRRAG